MIKKTRPRRKILLKTSAKSAIALIKSKCIIRLAKQRSIIKDRKLNSLIKIYTGSKESNSNHRNGSSINKRVVVNYPFIPVKLHIPLKKSREWMELAVHKKEIKPSISAEANILINKNVLVNQVTHLTRLVSYEAKVKSFFPDKLSVSINNKHFRRSNYLFKSKLSFHPGRIHCYE